MTSLLIFILLTRFDHELDYNGLNYAKMFPLIKILIGIIEASKNFIVRINHSTLPNNLKILYD